MALASAVFAILWDVRAQHKRFNGRYTRVREWKRGYLVVDAQYRHNAQNKEAHINLIHKI